MFICIAVCAALVCMGLALAYLCVWEKYRLSGKERAIAAGLWAVTAFAAFRLEQKGTAGIETVKILWVLALMTAAACTDMRERAVPNRLIIFGFSGRCLLYAAEFLTDPSRAGIQALSDLTDTGMTLAVLMLLVLVSRGSLGFGDVKLLGIVSLHCGLSWTGSCFFYGLLTAAFASAWLLAVKRAGRKHRIALAPFFLAGALITAIL